MRAACLNPSSTFNAECARFYVTALISLFVVSLACYMILTRDGEQRTTWMVILANIFSFWSSPPKLKPKTSAGTGILSPPSAVVPTSATPNQGNGNIFRRSSPVLVRQD